MKRLAVGGVARAMRQRHRPRRGAVPRLLSRSMASSNLSKGLNTKNPFEIKFHVEDLPEDAAEEVAAIESSFFEDEIEKFHSEMIGVFGSEPEEHDGGGDQPMIGSAPPSPSESRHSASAASHSIAHRPPPMYPHVGAYSQEPPSAQASLRPKIPSSALHRSPTTTTTTTKTTTRPSVLLIQGPCTYVHGGWVGSKDRWSAAEVATMVEGIAHAQGLEVVQHHSNHEGQVLDWLLMTSPGDKIILNWNGRLADSPVVFRALASIRAFVVLLTPLDVELGPLPPSVKGVITGFGMCALELAIQACK